MSASDRSSELRRPAPIVAVPLALAGQVPATDEHFLIHTTQIVAMTESGEAE